MLYYMLSSSIQILGPERETDPILEDKVFVSESNIRSLPEDDRPREKLVKCGPAVLSNSELLALLIQAGTREKNALDIARDILGDFSLDGLSGITLNKLTCYPGIGTAKAGQIIAALEISARLARDEVDVGEKIESSTDIINHLCPRMRELEQEELRAIHLSNSRNLLEEETLFVGTLDRMVVTPREVVKSCLRQNSKGVILAHNHPNGEPNPSKEDILSTKEIQKALEFVDVELLDHVIIGRSKAASLKREGYL